MPTVACRRYVLGCVEVLQLCYPGTSAPAASKAPTALELQAAEAKVTRLTNEVMRLRGMSVNCTDETVSARPFC